MKLLIAIDLPLPRFTRPKPAPRRPRVAHALVAGIVAFCGYAALAISLSGCYGMHFADHRCGALECDPTVTEFAPDPALQDEAWDALQRIGEATGRWDLELDDDGLPVTYAEGLETLDTETGEMVPICGLTTVARGKDEWPQSVEIELHPIDGCATGNTSVIHEFIHVLAPNAAHSSEGVFNGYSAGGPLLEETSLEALCGEFECLIFAPETELPAETVLP